MDVVTIAEQVKELIRLHGSVRAAGKALNISYAYLHRLGAGHLSNPSNTTLLKLGLVPTAYYVRVNK